MNLSKLFSDNSTHILSAVGVVGTVSTAVLTGRAAYASAQILAEESPHLEAKDRIALCWRLYIPAGVTGALTIASILAADQVGTRRAAGLAAAYSLSDRAFEDYRKRVLESVGPKRELAVRDEVAQRVVDGLPAPKEIIISGTDVVTVDLYSGRYFISNMEDIKKAQNDLNYKINRDMYASLSDFYDLLGLSRTEYSDEVGWTTDKLLELEITTGLTPDQKPCLAIGYRISPVRDYYKFG